MRSSTRWAASVVTLAVGLSAAFIAPVAADELIDSGDATSAVTEDDDDAEGGSALEHRRGHGHAFGLVERPQDGGGLARGHDKVGFPWNGPAHRPGGKGPGAAANPGPSDKTDPEHWHGRGKAPGHTHGTEHGPGHTHAPDDADVDAEVESQTP